MSDRAEALKIILEYAGREKVRVFWEPLGRAAEMCGPSGGWMYESDDDGDCLGTTWEKALGCACFKLVRETEERQWQRRRR